MNAGHARRIADRASLRELEYAAGDLAHVGGHHSLHNVVL